MVTLKKYKLSEVATFEISNIDKKTKAGELSVHLCNFTDVYYNWAVTEAMEDSFMVATASDNQIKKLLLRKGQVAITKDSETRHDIGIPTYIANDFDSTVLGYHCALITPNPEMLDGRYLNAYLNSSLAKEYFANNASGSGMRYSLPVDAIKNILLYLPSIEVQREIGKIFSAIDRKIALNREINRNLEAMARQLYDYWFVQFDFPDENGQPYKSSGGKMVWNDKLKREIPQGWEISLLETLISTNRGISYNTASISGNGIPMLNLATFNIDGTFKEKGLKTYSGSYSKDKVLQPMDLVMCNTQQTAIDFDKDIIGKAFLVPFCYKGDIVSSHHVTTIETKNKNLKPYLCYLSRTDHFHRYAAGCTTGTNITGLNFTGLGKYAMELPPESVLKKFADFIENIERRKSIIMLEMTNLTTQRDELLPLLMNGQVSIIPTAVNCDLSHD